MAERRRNRKWLWWGLGALVVIVTGVVLMQQGKKVEDGGEKTAETTGPTEQKSEDAGGASDGELTNVEAGEKQKVKQYEGEDPNVAEELSGVVTYAGVNDGMLMIRTSIDQYLTGGSCELILMRGDVTIYNGIADIVGDVATAVCHGFDVPVAELGEGELQIVINLSAGEKTGMIRGEVGL